MSGTSSRVIDALGSAATYPHPVSTVEVVQTHISWVFLAGDIVYKVKKPLDLGFLDFTTLRKRRYYCHQEVELNSRLCPDLYLGVVPIRDVDGTIVTGGKSGRIVEYAVQMHRLPQDRILENLLVAGQATDAMIDTIAETLAEFHAGSETGPEIDRFGSPSAIRRNWDENFEQTREGVGDTITPFQFDYLWHWVQASLRRHDALFRQRIDGGRVRDGHGDLRTSAVCFDDGLCIFDCIEFNRRLRYADVASDVAFLAMDLEANDRPDLAERFIDRYVEASGDDQLREIVDFYICYRAYVRGKVESMRALDPNVLPSDRQEARRIAIDRFDQAVRTANRQQPPLLLITCGLSGSGKSAIANRLASAEGISVVASDVVRKELAGLPATGRARSPYQSGIYTPAFTRKTYRELMTRGREALDTGRSVILDATFSSREWRDRAAELARKAGALFICLECRADDTVIQQRLGRREQDHSVVSDANWETFLAQRQAFDAVDELSDWQHLVLDTGQATLDETVTRARQALDERLSPAGISGS